MGSAAHSESTQRCLGILRPSGVGWVLSERRCLWPLWGPVHMAGQSLEWPSAMVQTACPVPSPWATCCVRGVSCGYRGRGMASGSTGQNCCPGTLCGCPRPAALVLLGPQLSTEEGRCWWGLPNSRQDPASSPLSKTRAPPTAHGGSFCMPRAGMKGLGLLSGGVG